jgi:hypothetical protein
MIEIFSELSECVAIYIDDIIFYSNSPEELKQQLPKVVDLLEKYSLTIKMPKCVFFQESINVLGFHVEKRVISLQKKKIDEAIELKKSTTLSQSESVIGFFTNLSD